ncbi:MAG: class I SAM-dependent methyltransferase, partial [Wenzhouxiangella sp.]|nr:class I SAM-dependent methyltransferase [Wenzhouxiangella sp.]
MRSQAAILYAQDELPVQSCLQPGSASDARAIERRPLELVACRGCGLVFNRAFDPATQRFDQGYEETQAYSAVFREFSDQLVDDLVARWRPEGATVVEIGCGKGDFLEALCRQGRCRGIGIDPAFEPGRRSPVAGVGFERRLFSTEDIGRRADFLICRHTLEHIGPVGEFLEQITEFCRAGGVREVFFEVPDAGRIVKEGAFWDVYYEHANYFGPGAFEAAFRHAGMKVVETSSLFFDQYLGLFARPESGRQSARASEPGEVDGWVSLMQERSAWQRSIE